MLIYNYIQYINRELSRIEFSEEQQGNIKRKGLEFIRKIADLKYSLSKNHHLGQKILFNYLQCAFNSIQVGMMSPFIPWWRFGILRRNRSVINKMYENICKKIDVLSEHFEKTCEVFQNPGDNNKYYDLKKSMPLYPKFYSNKKSTLLYVGGIVLCALSLLSIAFPPLLALSIALIMVGCSMSMAASVEEIAHKRCNEMGLDNTDIESYNNAVSKTINSTKALVEDHAFIVGATMSIATKLGLPLELGSVMGGFLPIEDKGDLALISRDTNICGKENVAFISNVEIVQSVKKN